MLRGLLIGSRSSHVLSGRSFGMQAIGRCIWLPYNSMNLDGCAVIDGKDKCDTERMLNLRCQRPR